MVSGSNLPLFGVDTLSNISCATVLCLSWRGILIVPYHNFESETMSNIVPEF
jgi:hypothetical protein